MPSSIFVRLGVGSGSVFDFLPYWVSFQSLIPDIKPGQDAVVDLHPEEAVLSGAEEEMEEEEEREQPDQDLQIRRTVTQVRDPGFQSGTRPTLDLRGRYREYKMTYQKCCVIMGVEQLFGIYCLAIKVTPVVRLLFISRSSRWRARRTGRRRQRGVDGRRPRRRRSRREARTGRKPRRRRPTSPSLESWRPSRQRTPALMWK